MVVNASLPGGDQAFSLAHELGHVLLRRADSAWVGAEDEELICDEFARSLVTANPFVTPSWVSAWNRLESGPGVQFGIVGDKVVCSLCGPRRRRWPCDCRRLRVALAPVQAA
ncbi:MAG: ImmA/IrrE family metallo-endopeptidase [Acidimicrobiales bacterium]